MSGDRNWRLLDRTVSRDILGSRKMRNVITLIINKIICSSIVKSFTASWRQTRKWNHGLASAMSTKNTSRGLTGCTSVEKSVLSAGGYTSRRTRPITASILTAPLIKTNINYDLPKKKIVMVDMTVLQLFVEL